MNTTIRQFALALTVAGVHTSAALAAAVPDYSSVDTSRWDCRRCSDDAVTQAPVSLSVGASATDARSPRFGRDTGRERDAVYADVDGSAHHQAGGHSLAIDATDLGLDSRRIEASVGKTDRYNIAALWAEIPRANADGQTPYAVTQSGGTSQLTLPAGWVRQNDTAAMDLDAAARPFINATQRQKGQVDAAVRFGDWRVSGNVSRETKRGTLDLSLIHI